MNRSVGNHHAVRIMIFIIAIIVILPQLKIYGEKRSESQVASLLDKLMFIPGPSLQEEAVAQYMADTLNGWRIATTLNEKEPYVIGRIPGSGPKVSLVAHIDEPRFVLTDINEANMATFDGVFFAPTWYRSELAKYLTYLELTNAPIIQNPQGNSNLVLYVPAWDIELPVLGWTAKNIKHQIATVKLNKDNALAAKTALAAGKKIVAINKNGLSRTTDPLLGQLVIGSPLDNRVGVALILSLAHYYKDKSTQDRPDIDIVGRPREELALKLQIPEIAESDLLVIMDSPPMHFYPVLGGGPVIVWNPQRTPPYLVDIFMNLPLYKGCMGLPGRIKGTKTIFSNEVQVFKAEDQSLLTVVADDAGQDVPCFFIGPTMLRYHTSEEKMSIKDIEECENLMIALLDQIAKRASKNSASDHSIKD